MSIEEKSQPQPINQDIYEQLKCHALHTTACSTIQRNTNPTPSDFDIFCSSSTDCSFDLGIHQQNINQIKIASIELLEECLVDEFDRDKGFRDMSIYGIAPYDFSNEGEIQGLIGNNQLLSQGQKQSIVKILKKEEDLIGLLRLVVPSFGLTVGKQIVVAMFQILSSKLLSFNKLIQSTNTILPKFNCFQGFEDNFTILQTSCPIYEEINLKQVIQFAERDIDNISSSIYFSNKIQYINLHSVKSEIKPKVTVLKKFDNFIKEISKIVFLTIVGATEPNQNCLEPYAQTNLVQCTTPQLLIKRVSSPPSVPYEQQNLDFISKKLKFDIQFK